MQVHNTDWKAMSIFGWSLDMLVHWCSCMLQDVLLSPSDFASVSFCFQFHWSTKLGILPVLHVATLKTLFKKFLWAEYHAWNILFQSCSIPAAFEEHKIVQHFLMAHTTCCPQYLVVCTHISYTVSLSPWISWFCLCRSMLVRLELVC